jgi:hypothetical protein
MYFMLLPLMLTCICIGVRWLNLYILMNHQAALLISIFFIVVNYSCMLGIQYYTVIHRAYFVSH